MNYDPPIAHYRHMKVPDEWKNHMSKIVGKDGCHFIRATEKSGCQYIWHDQDNDHIEFWGPHSSLMLAETHVRLMGTRLISCC